MIFNQYDLNSDDDYEIKINNYLHLCKKLNFGEN